MKKSLIALAALAAVGAASAQSSVTLYGIVDTGYGWEQTKVTQDVGGVRSTVKVRNIGLRSGELSGSRWGLKGQEDLGNGLAAVFNVEAGFDSSNGRTGGGFDFSNIISGKSGVYGNGFNRRAVVGLKGSFGQVLLGRDYTPLDAIADGPYQAVDRVTADGIGGWDLYTARADGIHYSGNFNGFGVQAFAGYNEDKLSVDGTTHEKVKDEGYGLGVGYATGPFAIGAAVQHFKDKTFFNIAPVPPTTTSAKRTEYGIGASYDFGAAKVLGHYVATDPDNAKTLQQFGLGVNVPVGAVTLGAQYAYNKWGEFKGHDFGLQAVYALSKRTDVYARGGRFNSWKDKTAGQYYKTNTDMFTVGLRHRF